MSGEKRSIYWRGRYYRTIGELDKAFRKGRKVAIMSLLVAYAIQFPHVDITKNIRFTNREVKKELAKVVEMIQDAYQKTWKSPHRVWMEQSGIYGTE